MINPPGIKLDDFTDLIFRFSGLPAHTADWPPPYVSLSVPVHCLCKGISKDLLWTAINRYIISTSKDLMIIPPIWNCQSSEWALCFSMWSMRAHSKSQLIGRYKEMSVWHQVKLMMTPPLETARAQSELFTFQCGQWEPIRNSQLIGRYKEMSVWHQVKLMMTPPIRNCQSSEWTLSLFNVVNESPFETVN